MEPENKYSERVHKALLAAFSEGELTQMLSFCMKEDMSWMVSSQDNYEQKVFQVIAWAKRRDRLDELVNCACERNPTNALLQGLLPSNGGASNGAANQPYISAAAVAAISSSDTAALVSRIAEWKNLHHAVQELLFSVQISSRTLMKLRNSAQSVERSRELADGLQDLWIQDTAPKVGALDRCLGTLRLISSEEVVKALVRVLGEYSLSENLYTLDAENAQQVAKACRAVDYVYSMLVEGLRASDDWIRSLVDVLSGQLINGGGR